MKYKTITTAVTASLLLLFAMCSSTAFAQDANKDDGITPITRAGSASFMFSVGGPQTFGLTGPSENGSGNPSVIAGAGMKYYISDRLAGRLLLSFGTTSSGPDSAKTTGSTYGVGVALEYHCHDLYAISPYFGGGIGFITGNTTQDSTINPAGAGKGSGVHTLASNTFSSENSQSAFTVSALAGFDWFFVKSIAIGSEFSLGFVSASRSSTLNGTSTSLPSATSFGISGVGNVHLLVYF